MSCAQLCDDSLFFEAEVTLRRECWLLDTGIRFVMSFILVLLAAVSEGEIPIYQP